MLLAQDRADQEIVYPSKDFAKLDTFESLNLEDADKLFPAGYKKIKPYLRVTPQPNKVKTPAE